MPSGTILSIFSAAKIALTCIVTKTTADKNTINATRAHIPFHTNNEATEDASYSSQNAEEKAEIQWREGVGVAHSAYDAAVLLMDDTNMLPFAATRSRHCTARQASDTASAIESERK